MQENWLWGFDQFINDITTTRGKSMSNYEKAVKIYEDAGQYAVYKAVEKGQLFADAWRDCLPCEDRTPHEGGACLVCGTTYAEEV
jgi:hypothetical protein